MDLRYDCPDVKHLLLLSLTVVACTPHALRTVDFNGISKLAFVQTAGSTAAVGAIEEELQRELPALDRFELVTDVDAADATVDLSVDTWWLNEPNIAPVAVLMPTVRRVETMKATFHLVADGVDVSQAYQRTASSAPYPLGESLITDDLVAANAVQVVAAFLDDLKAGGAFTPSQPAPAQTAPQGEQAVPL
jgi:hypothetical protein